MVPKMQGEGELKKMTMTKVSFFPQYPYVCLCSSVSFSDYFQAGSAKAMSQMSPVGFTAGFLLVVSFLVFQSLKVCHCRLCFLVFEVPFSSVFSIAFSLSCTAN